MVVSAHQVVAGGFAGAVGTVGFVGVLLGKGRCIRRQAAIDLVGRNVQKTKCGFVRITQAVVVGAGRFQQIEGANDIGLDEIFRAVDGTIHMAFGREIDDGAWFVLHQELVQQRLVANIALHKDVPLVVFQRGQRFKIACIGQFVEIDDRLITLHQPVKYKIATYEACTTCYQYCHSSNFLKKSGYK